jgi:alpha-beta hydrolase superfamily lysophospholipase
MARLATLVQFFPLSVFATYAFWEGVPTGARWIAAFELAAGAAVLQFALLWPRRGPTNRLVLGVNLYLLTGGAAALTRQWWVLETYGRLQESGIFLFILGVGLVTTVATRAGFVAVVDASAGAARRASLWLAAATLGAAVVAHAFQGRRLWSAVAPMIVLAALQGALAGRLRAPTTTLRASARVAVRRIAVGALVVALGGLAARALVAAAPESRPVYDERGVRDADYSGLPAPTTLLARDGTPLALRVYRATSDTVIVALHGSSGRGRYFHPLATRLSRAGAASVHALDLRGHGESGGRRGDVDYVGQLDDDLADVLAAIRSERPAARIVLLGHSAGGGLAVRYAGRETGPRADGYVLLAPYLGPAAATTKPNAGGWALPDVARIAELSQRAARGDTSGQEAIVLRFRQPALSADPLQVLAYSFRMMASLAPRRDLARDLGALREPLLLLVGDRDESFHPDRYAPTIAPHARGTFTVLPGVTHLGLVTDPRTAEAVATWLAGRP